MKGRERGKNVRNGEEEFEMLKNRERKRICEGCGKGAGNGKGG